MGILNVGDLILIKKGRVKKVREAISPYRGETLFALHERRRFLLGQLRELDERIRHRTAMVVMCNAGPSWLGRSLLRLGWWLICREQTTFNDNDKHCKHDAGYLCNEMPESICEMENDFGAKSVKT